MSDLIHFLLVFNRTSGELVSIDKFEDQDLAISALSLLERSHEDDDQIEVVLISADSVETLKKTHGHYFFGMETILDYNKLLNA
ncbi:MAG: hypothetical protein Q8K86_02340 [Candidatus Nanopelagicaceae bacterium]|nr:hypothetical protein [Candidatus Nanopelagicaceae bacterium]